MERDKVADIDPHEMRAALAEWAAGVMYGLWNVDKEADDVQRKDAQGNRRGNRSS